MHGEDSTFPTLTLRMGNQPCDPQPGLRISTLENCVVNLVVKFLYAHCRIRVSIVISQMNILVVLSSVVCYVSAVWLSLHALFKCFEPPSVQIWGGL